MPRSRWLVVVPLILALTLEAAVGHFSAGTTPASHGAASATTLDPGARPSATAGGSSVALDWDRSTLSNGDPVGGYRVARYDATTGAPQPVGGSCAGIVVAASCIEDDLAPGTWQYAVTPVLGTHWSGPASPLSDPVNTASTPPVNDISTSDVTGNVALQGATIYYRGVAPGSFTLTNALSDPGGDAASSSTADLVGDTTGWTHLASRVTTPTGGPYVSRAVQLDRPTTSAPSETVTGRDAAGDTATATFDLVDDSAAPTGAAVSYADGFQPDRSVVLTLGAGTDAGSGVATRHLQRSSAALTAGACQAFGDFTDLGGGDPTSPYTDSTVADGTCYRYRYLVSDRVSNRLVATTTAVAKIGLGPPLGDASGFSVLAGTGVANTGATSVSGDLGTSPSASVAGFPPGRVAGSIHAADSVAAAARQDLVAAYADAAGRTATGSFAGDLNGQTFHPGVWHTASAFALTGTLTLDADGDPNAVFVFQVDAALNTAAASTIVLVDGAQASHVYFQVQGAAGTGADSSFSGTILAAGAITLGASTQLTGRALSMGTVTLSTNTIRFTTALPPTLTIDGGPNAATKDATPTISGTTDAAPGTSLTLRLADQVLTTTVLSDGTWAITTAALTAGVHHLTASVRDPAGNAGTATQSLTVEINPDPVHLATAASYSVLAATGVVNTGATTLSGDLGISPATAITGFPPGTVDGATHLADAAADQAARDLAAAYDDLDGRAPHTQVVGDLGGQTFHGGVHHSTSALALTGTLTLDAEGDPGAVFVFQGDAALNTAAVSTIVLVNGAQASNVYFQVQGAAGTGADSSFSGTILAAGAITLGASTHLTGRALSMGTVTLSTIVVSTPSG